MIRKDIITRFMEDTAKLIALLIGKDPKEALEMIDKAYTEWMGFGIEELKQKAPEALLEFLLREKGLDVYRIEALAILLDKEGDIHLGMDQLTTAKDCFIKALLLFEYAEKELQVFSFERQAKLTKIRNLITELSS